MAPPTSNSGGQAIGWAIIAQEEEREIIESDFRDETSLCSTSNLASYSTDDVQEIKIQQEV